MRPLVLVAVALCAYGCGAPSKAVSAGVAAGAAVAAAGIYRQATGSCWADCPTGKRCDHATGTCVDVPCKGRCPADSRCVGQGSLEHCERVPRDVAGAGGFGRDADAGALEPAFDPSAPDPCGGECLPSQRCVKDGGLATCELDDPPE